MRRSYHSNRSRGEVEETAAEVAHFRGEPRLFDADLMRVSEIIALYDAIDRKFGRLEILINTAGKVVKKPFVEITEDDFDQSSAVNTKTAFLCMQEAAKRIADSGRIISIGTTLQAATTGLDGGFVAR